MLNVSEKGRSTPTKLARANPRGVGRSGGGEVMSYEIAQSLIFIYVRARGPSAGEVQAHKSREVVFSSLSRYVLTCFPRDACPALPLIDLPHVSWLPSGRIKSAGDTIDKRERVTVSLTFR